MQIIWPIYQRWLNYVLLGISECRRCSASKAGGEASAFICNCSTRSRCCNAGLNSPFWIHLAVHQFIKNNTKW